MSLNFNTILADEEEAKEIGKLLYQRYNKQERLELQNSDLAEIFTDVYSGIHQSITWDHNDVEGLKKVLDRNEDNKISQSDFESICIHYLCGGEVIQQIKHRISTTNYKKQIEIARNTFQSYEKKEQGAISKKNIGDLIVETFKSMGINYVPSETELQVWTSSTGTGGLQQVSSLEYQGIILNSLDQIKDKVKLD